MKTKKKFTSRLFAAILALAMVCGLMPMPAFAAEITTENIIMSEPVVGEPNSSVTFTWSNGSVSGISQPTWQIVGSGSGAFNFRAGETYKVSLILTLTSDDTFASNASITINGEPTEIVSRNGDKSINVSYTFTMPSTHTVTVSNQNTTVGSDVFIAWPEGADEFKLYESGGSSSISSGEKSGFPSGMNIPAQSTATTKTYYFSVLFPGDGWVKSNEFTVTWANITIQYVNLTGLDAPRADMPLDFDANETDEYTVKSINWSDCTAPNGWLSPGDKAVGNHDYLCEIWLSPKEYYKFSNSPKVVIPITGAYNVSSKLYADGDLKISFYIWTDYGYINDINITGHTAPETGQTPDFTAESKDGKTVVTEVAWVNASDDWENMTEYDTFLEGKNYQCYIYVKGNEDAGYKIDNGRLTGSIEGFSTDDVEINRSVDGKNIYFRVDYTRNLISNVDIQGVNDPIIGEMPTTVGIGTNTTAVEIIKDQTNWVVKDESTGQWKYTNSAFEAGKTYGIKVTVKSNNISEVNTYEFAENTTATVNGNSAAEVDKTGASGKNREIIYSFGVLGGSTSTGVNLSGTFTSFGDESEETIMQLISQGYSEASYEIAPTGNSGTYTISNVVPGTYTLKVMKAKHCAREYTVTVGSSDVTQDVEIRLYGDIYKDGKINNVDALQIQRLLDKKTSVFDSASGDDLVYLRKVADVYTADGQLGNVDALQIQRHANKKASIFDSIP